MRTYDPSIELKDALSERDITDFTLLAFEAGNAFEQGRPLDFTRAVQSRGDVQRLPNYVRANFSGGDDVYQLRLRFGRSPRTNGLSIRFSIGGWSRISYLAIGHTLDGAFRHVKIPNPAQAEWLTFSVGFNDIAFYLQNGWEPVSAIPVGDIRLYVKGAPAEGGAELSISWAAVWLDAAPLRVNPAAPDPPKVAHHHSHLVNRISRRLRALLPPEARSTRLAERRSHTLPLGDWNRPGDAPKTLAPRLRSALQRYFARSNADLDATAEVFMQKGHCPLGAYGTLDWSIDDTLPRDLAASVTYRYLWHAMQPAVTLILYGAKRRNFGALCAARDFVSRWLEASFFTPDRDPKYAWYDHGTAERLLAFILMYDIGKQYGFDYRFLSRLALAIVKHAQLLESETFYASDQNVRYHNHAWFQDLALIATALAFSHTPCSERWLNRGLQRLSRQFAELIVRDHGYAIFVENSIGYHRGVQSLVEFAADLVAMSGKASDIPRVAVELRDWSSYLRYPDKRSPAHGDTYRRPNVLSGTTGSPSPYREPHLLVLPKAGYAVAKGNHENRPFMLCFFSTSLSETHKHEDNLSFTLFFDGLEWLIDPSFYSHDYDDAIPRYLRSALAHNNVAIEGQPYLTEPGRSRVTGSSKEGGFVIEGEHRAYDGYTVARRLAGRLDCLELSGADSIRSEERSSCRAEAYLLFHTGEGVSAVTQGAEAFLVHPASSFQLRIACQGRTPDLICGFADGRAVNGVAGTGYRKITDTTTVAFPIRAGEVVSWTIASAR